MERVKSFWKSARTRGARGLAIAGGISLTSSAVSYYAQSSDRKAGTELPAEFVLELDLHKYSVVDTLSADPLAILSGDSKQVEMRGVLRALAAARDDLRVRGLVTVLGPREHLGGMASVQELRDAVSSFRLAAASRAPTLAFSTSFGEAGENAMAQYYLACASEQVYMQPTGLLGLLGFATSEIFMRSLLDKLHVEPLFLAREEYKSFANRFRNSSYSPPHREQMTTLLTDISQQVLSHISLSRDLTALHSKRDATQREAGAAAASAVIAAANTLAIRRPDSTAVIIPVDPHVVTDENALAAPMSLLVDRSPLLSSIALKEGLVNGLKYFDECMELFLKSDKLQAKDLAKVASPSLFSRVLMKRAKPVKKELERISLERYLRLMDKKEVALLQQERAGFLGGTVFAPIGQAFRGLQIGATGDALKGQKKVAIVTTAGVIMADAPAPASGGEQVIAASTVVAALNALREDPDVCAVVLRINSGGGSALASDTLHHALERLKASGKKLIVSMGDVAASGGYMMAAPADFILAQPATVTGSIGVIFGKFNVAGALQEVGLNPESICVGANANVFSPLTSFTEAQLVAANASIDDIYTDFINKVAEGRHMEPDVVRGLAKGQVYTGRQALAIGLVDKLGGLEDAIVAARAAAELPDDAYVYDYPERRLSPFLLLLSGLMPAEARALAQSASAKLAGADAGTGGVIAVLATIASACGLGGGAAGLTAGSAAAGSGGRGSSAALAALTGIGGGAMCYSPEAEMLSRCT